MLLVANFEQAVEGQPGKCPHGREVAGKGVSGGGLANSPQTWLT